VLSENARQQGEMWGWRARDWAELIEPSTGPVWRGVLDDLQLAEGASLLDAGCGTGGATALALGRGFQVKAFDAAGGFLDYARRRMPGADIRLGDLQAIPFGDNEFDAAFAVNSVQFTADPVRALRELGRVAPRIGVVIWTMPDECDMRHVFNAIGGLFPKRPSGRGPFELSDPGEMEGLMTQAGLTPVNSRAVKIVQRYMSIEESLRAVMSTGPSHRGAQILGEEKVEAAIRGVLQPFVADDGGCSMTNWFRVLTAVRA